MVETEVLVSEDISTEVQQIEPRRRDEDDYRMRCTLPYCMVHGDSSPTPCLVTWGRLTITKTPVYRDNTEPDRITAKDESKVGKSVKEDVYKRTVLEKHREESSSRGEIFCGQKSKVTIEDVSSEDPRRQENDYFQVEPIVEEAKEEENLAKSPQRKESVVIEELLDDISEGKENGSSLGCCQDERERVHTEADIALREKIERCRKGDLPKLPQRKESVIIEELLDDISEGEEKNEEMIKKESTLKDEETLDMASPQPLLSGTKLDTSVLKKGKVSNDERRDIQIMEKSLDVEFSTVVDHDGSDKAKKEEVIEDRMDKVNVVVAESCVEEIGLIDNVKVFGIQDCLQNNLRDENQDSIRTDSREEGTKLMVRDEVIETDQGMDDRTPSMRESFVKEDHSSRNTSKEYFGSPEREIIHTEADVALSNMIARCKNGGVAEEGFLVERKSLKLGENVGSCDKDEKMLEDDVVRKILKEYGDEEENSEHVLLGFERQEQSRNLARLLLLLLLLLLPLLLLPRLLLPSHPASCAHQEESAGGAGVGDRPPNNPASGSSCTLDGYVFLSSLP